MNEKDEVINDLLSRIAKLEWEVEDLEKENEVLKRIIKDVLPEVEYE